MNKYRFDNAYEKVYEYDKNAKAYVFVGTYYAFGLTTRMNEKAKITRVKGEGY